MPSPLTRVIAATFTLVIVPLGACGQTPVKRQTASAAKPNALGPGDFSMRAVLNECPVSALGHPDAGPGTLMPKRSPHGDVIACFRVGDARITAGDIMRAAARRGQQGDDWQVDITLTGAGSEKFDALAHEQYQRQIAIVVDSTVKSAPTVQAQSFGGSAQLTGFDQAGAESLARRINAAAS